MIDSCVEILYRRRLVIYKDVIENICSPTAIATLHSGASRVVHQYGIVPHQIAMTAPERQVSRTFNLGGRRRAWLDVSFVIRIGVIPLRDAVIEISVDEIVLN